MPKKNNIVLDNLKPYEDEKFKLEAQDIEKNYRDLVSKSSDTRSYAKDSLLKHIP